MAFKVFIDVNFWIHLNEGDALGVTWKVDVGTDLK
jgi:hypothetical protein